MQILNTITAIFKNFYFLSFLGFVAWMVFLDSNDVVSQFKLRNKLNNLEAEKAYYQEKIEEVEKDREELLSNTELLEKFAREKYLMRKKTEDLYVIVRKEEE